jgi:hypothetical protein
VNPRADSGRDHAPILPLFVIPGQEISGLYNSLL